MYEIWNEHILHCSRSWINESARKHGWDRFDAGAIDTGGIYVTLVRGNINNMERRSATVSTGLMAELCIGKADDLIKAVIKLTEGE